MNEKISIVFIISLLLLTLSGCCTMAGVRNNGGGAYAVRENIGELTDQQTEAAIASEQLNRTLESAREQSENLNREITASRADSEQLKQSITDGKGELDIFDGILQQIRERYVRNNSGKASPN